MSSRKIVQIILIICIDILTAQRLRRILTVLTLGVVEELLEQALKIERLGLVGNQLNLSHIESLS